MRKISRNDMRTLKLRLSRRDGNPIGELQNAFVSLRRCAVRE